METKFSSRDVKHYPHFDQHMKLKEVEELVTDPVRVAAHKFYPFLLYHESWQPFRTKVKNGEKVKKPDKKPRPIRYAARKDAYILTYYRRLLSEKYEEELLRREVSFCPIAYRKIRKLDGGGKCNIDFAKDAFDEIERQGNCVAVALDIKSYFEKLDHDRIKSVWCSLLGVERLPPDHYRVFKAVTNYRVVDQKDVYRRLGIIETVMVNGYPRERYTLKYEDMPTQLCTPKVFREKICPKGNSLIRGNVDDNGIDLDHGIPQGAPISDLIANFYLLDFDVALNAFAHERGGRYMRYSDDILLIFPGGTSEANSAIDYVTEEISKYGRQLQIKPEKTCVVCFNRTTAGLIFSHLQGPQGKNGFEYLGFRFDGKKVFVRDSTISRLYRKVSESAKGVARGFALANKSKNASELIKEFNYSAFSQRFSRVHPDKLEKDDYETWSFYSYLKRAAETFGHKGDPIIPQAKSFKRLMKERIAEAMVKAVVRRDKDAEPIPSSTSPLAPPSQNRYTLPTK